MISVIIPTKNSERTLLPCLQSIKEQTYRDYEIIIVDGHSTDGTLEIARRYTDRIISSEAGRSEARNLGFSKTDGDVFLSIDSDMILERTLLQEISQKMKNKDALVIPEVGYGKDFLSRCKDLEKRCYINDEIIESVRAFSRQAFEGVGGYDPKLIFGEDWDIHQRLKERYPIGRTASRILHNTTQVSLSSNLAKSYLYGNTIQKYLDKEHPQTREWLRLRNLFFLRHFSKLVKEPFYALGLFIIKAMEYSFGFAGFLAAELGFHKAGR